MRRSTAALGSAVFLLAAPGVVAGLVPWWLTRYASGDGPWPVRAAGGLLALAGTAVLLHGFARFVREGRGTPAPVAPTERLVTGGAYARVRNPMYLAVVALVAGQGLLLLRPVLLLYAAAVWLTVAAFVRWYEEPTLRAAHGEEYEAYRRAVPAWLPRCAQTRSKGSA
ncbi:isoprenylcysteine carboxylmethyltransferase family protein [Actinacidiphila glaucinigra]|uniref:methyltransferase family protein n=1 Tax=Actinacidiphila glaucinigra TaxID=235986 RepID=UPI0033F6029B